MALPLEHHLIDTPTRYRQTPTFGRDTIRMFSTNVSEMKKLAARDFEDVLQVKFGSFLYNKDTYLLTLSPSVHYLSSKVFFRSHTISM